MILTFYNDILGILALIEDTELRYIRSLSRSYLLFRAEPEPHALEIEPNPPCRQLPEKPSRLIPKFLSTYFIQTVGPHIDFDTHIEHFLGLV